MKWRIDLPQLQSVKLGNQAFHNGGTFRMSNLPSLQSIYIGQDCFSGTYHNGMRGYDGGALSLSLIGKNGTLKRRIDLPKLQSVIIGNDAFKIARYFELSNLASIEYIEIGSGCFSGYYDQHNQRWECGAISFSLNGNKELLI